MKLILEARIMGKPLPQLRPRAFVKAGKASVYDPERNVDWKRTVIVQVLPMRPATPSSAALRVEMTFHMPRPKSLQKRITKHVRKPDLDNLVKSVKDALTGIVWDDDSQIVQLVAEKIYDPVLGVSLVVFEMEGGTR